MSDKKNNDYLIDIASDSQYQNQSDEYYKSYTRWRMNENNRFGYKFVKDKREHTYAYGEGYEHKKASDAEKKALRSCASLTGGCLLVAAFLRLMQEIFDSGTSQLMKDGTLILTSGGHSMDILNAFILLGAKLVMYLAAGIVFMMFIKLPREVYFAKRTIKPAHVVYLLGILNGIAMIWYLIFVFGSFVLPPDWLALPVAFFRSGSVWLDILYIFLDYIVISFIKAVFFNGLLTQSLRQFGDSTSIFLVSVLEGLMVMNIRAVGATFVLSMITGLIILKTGSVIMGAAARISVNLSFYLAGLINYSTGGRESEIYLIIIEVLVIGFGLFCMGRLMARNDWDFNIDNVTTSLSFWEKVSVFFTAMPMIGWTAAVIVMQLYVLLV